MSFFTINQALEYLATLNQYETHYVFRPLQYNLINHFGGDERAYVQWVDRFVDSESHGESVHGHSMQYHKFNYKNIRPSLGYTEPSILVNQTDLTNHQLAVILPNTSYYLWPIISQEEKNSIMDNDFKQFTKNLGFTYSNFVRANQHWVEQDYEITINKVQEYLLVTHEIKILMSDSFYSHPDCKFWIASVEMNNPIDPEAMTVKVDIRFRTLFSSQKLKTKININNALIGSQWGYPLAIYLVDNQFVTLKNYMYQGLERPLEEIIPDIGEKLRLFKISNDSLMYIYRIFEGVTADQLKAIAAFDAQEVMHEMSVLHARVTQLTHLSVTVKVEDINLAVTSAGSSFWGNLIGGIAGGALGALGQALGAAITTKGQIFSSLTDSVLNIVNDSIQGGLEQMNDNYKHLVTGQAYYGDKLTELQQSNSALIEKVRYFEEIVNKINTWIITDPETGEQKIINLHTKISNMAAKISELETKLLGNLDHTTTNSGKIEENAKEIKEHEAKLKALKHMIMVNQIKLDNINEKITSMTQTVPRNIGGTPPTTTERESLQTLPDDTKSILTDDQEELLTFLDTVRIRNILKVNGQFDKLEDHVLETTTYVNKLLQSVDNLRSAKGLIASFTTGARPFSGDDI